MARSCWRSGWVLPVAWVLGCGHPAPRQDPRVDERGSGAAEVRSVPPIAARGDEVHARSIDGTVIENHAEGAELQFTIALPADVKAGQLTSAWTGLFLRDGKAIFGTEFKLVQVKPRSAVARITGQPLPSETVRLYEPYTPGGLR